MLVMYGASSRKTRHKAQKLEAQVCRLHFAEHVTTTPSPTTSTATGCPIELAKAALRDDRVVIFVRGGNLRRDEVRTRAFQKANCGVL